MFKMSVKNPAEISFGAITGHILEEMRASLAKMCIEDAPSVRAAEQLGLYKQQTTKRRREYLLRDKTVLNVSLKKLMYYITMRCFIMWRVVILLLRLTGRWKI